MLEQYLINHCAPTLASLKTANLFNCTAENPTALQMAVSRWQALLAPKGVELLLLRESGNRALVYVYRPDRLARDLQQPGVAAFLAHCGYTGTAPAACLEVLRRKLAVSSDFPHEISLFLGYPLGDVIGFIENHGQNCLCCGVWKVYTNPEAAAGAFRKFSKCTRVYRRLFFGGQRNVEQLTVKSA